MDIESPEIEMPQLPRHAVRRTRTSRLVTAEIRGVIAQAYRSEVGSMVKWRGVWKRFGDACEAIAKGLTGVSAVLAFASSATQGAKTADILSFTSGAVGTLGLVLLTYSSYAIGESRQRTSELNHILGSIGVTPVPDIATLESSEA
jgi:hypothetical protein